MIEQRMHGQALNDEAYFERFIALAKRYPGSCDGVWLFILQDWIDMSVHKRYIDRLKPIAEALKKAGIRVSLQGLTVGHGYTDDPKAGFSETRDVFGRRSGHICARDKRFLEAVDRVYGLYARELKPYAVWPDDDLRIRDWSKAPQCLCDNCVRQFNEAYGHRLDRAALTERIKTDTELRLQFVEFSYEGLAGVGETVTRAVKRGSPETLLGLQNGGYGNEAFLRILERMKETGGSDVLYRAGAGGYSDRNPADILYKAHQLDFQLSRLPDYVFSRCPEVENYAHSYYSKSPYGTCVESALNLSQGFDFISVVSIANNQEDFTFVESVFAEYAKNRAYFERLAAANVNTRRSGMQIYVPENYWNTPREDWYNLNPDEVTAHSYHGLPVTYQSQKNPTYILTGKLAAALSDKEIHMLLKRPVLTDGEALHVLSRRGYEALLGAKAEPGGAWAIYFTGHRINADVTVPQFHAGFNEVYYSITGGEALSYYRTPESLGNEPKPAGAVSDAVITTAYGAKWAVFGCAAWTDTVSYSRRMQIYRAVLEIGGSVPVFVREPNRLVLLPRENAEQKTTSITVYNNSISPSDSVTLQIENAAAGEYLFVYDQTERILPKTTADGVDSVRLPAMKSYSIGTLFIGV